MMFARRVCARDLLIFAASLLFAACYDLPSPDCGFRCGAGGTCPESYVCNADDGFCHHEGGLAGLCGAPIDAGVDAPEDAISMQPRVLSTQPPNGQIEVSRAPSIEAVLSEDVLGVSTSTFIVIANGTLVPTASAVYTPGDLTARLILNGLLAPATTHTVLLSDVTDLDGNLSVPHSWTFTTTADADGPVVMGQVPADGATGVAVDTSIDVLFDEAVQFVTPQSFRLFNGVNIVSVSAPLVSGLLISIDPVQQLAPNTVYTVSVQPPIADLYSNPVLPFTSSFTTGADTVQPSIASSNPANTSTGVATSSTIIVFFDEPVDITAATFQVNGGAIAGSLAQPFGTTSVQFTPQVVLPAASAITVDVAGITDTSGNTITPATITFTTQ